MSPHKYYQKTESVNTEERSVNTMTERTKTLSIRLNTEDKDAISKYLNRGSVEAILRQIKRGEISITSKGVVIERVNTISESVNTSVDTADCENCPYANDLDMTEFDDVCKLRGIDRQKALDKCVQMLWR